MTSEYFRPYEICRHNLSAQTGIFTLIVFLKVLKHIKRKLKREKVEELKKQKNHTKQSLM
jgi:hypothetical protein